MWSYQGPIDGRWLSLWRGAPKTSLGWWDMKQGQVIEDDRTLTRNSEDSDPIVERFENWWPGIGRWRLGMKWRRRQLSFRKESIGRKQRLWSVQYDMACFSRTIRKESFILPEVYLRIYTGFLQLRIGIDLVSELRKVENNQHVNAYLEVSGSKTVWTETKSLSIRQIADNFPIHRDNRGI